MIPSRHMPPPEVASEAPGVVLWAPLLGFAGFGVWVLGQAWLHTPVFGAGLTGIILLGLWEMRRDSRRLERFVRQRAAETTGDEICRFARNFDRRTVDPWVVRAVYEELADWMSEPDAPFAPRADDDLFRDLRLDPDDLDLDMVPAICARIGKSLEGVDDNPLVGKVETVADLVHFLNGQPRTDASQPEAS